MANQHEHIDLTTLKEVERLLTSADIASLGDFDQRPAPRSEAPVPSTEGLAPLPRRG